ncbi:zinc-dependent alcohol dehydrogenase family protein [Aliikangiella marina]|uniref:Zinc-dependent alcohol dehydrogenase family protein n=1 Tax=Aliikangiella marina TaxID=1712262 RepID=A0A545T106_9GAMM|nr:zinc-dependent alcohol dehydrogenase family protein [Aliikangiella marina]TQV70894.1 zinc-dependent alcohol dehydrogenase family protein [Aliikangiella marina]
MKAVLFESFQSPPKLVNVDDPAPNSHGAVIKVMATGVCRSDWHGWMGHDPEVVLPHVPGHEFAGIIEAVGKSVSNWKVGDRVAIPFIAGCGECAECESGNQQVCAQQTQPGFTHWGSFAEYTAVDQVDSNLVPLAESIEFETAASLGCRFATAFRAVVSQGQVKPGAWLAVHGCGGVGLSAIMIAKAMQAKVIAVDIFEDSLDLARSCGADLTLNAKNNAHVAEALKSMTNDSIQVSLDAFGSTTTCLNSIRCLKARGKHIQVGLMVDKDSQPQIPMGLVLAKELEIIGSHGMPAPDYAQMMKMIFQEQLKPQSLIKHRLSLSDGIAALTRMDQFDAKGVTIINSFE